MALESHFYRDPAEVLDRIREDRKRDAAAFEKKESVRRKKKGRRIKNYMKKLGVK